MDLTVGPIAFFWDAARVREFYAGLAKAPVARVVIGEWVCPKRLPFWQNEIPDAVETLIAAGKEVALSTLALITLVRERRQTADLLGMGLPVEVNDLSALQHIPAGTPFQVGPMVNVYNEGTLQWLAKRGATRIALPPELPLSSVATLAGAGREMGVAVEVWGHGRVPLAISGRCYHARMNGRSKDNCQFVCGDDPDGRDVDTLDGRRFLTVNGVQTLGRTITSAARQIDELKAAGVASIRLSPHVGDFVGVARAWSEALAGDQAALLPALDRLMLDAIFSDGFLAGHAGASMDEVAAG